MRGSAILFYQTSRLLILRPSSSTFHLYGSFFQLRLLQALPSLCYKPRQFVFMPRLSQGTPTAKDKTGEALNSTYVTGGVGHLITILTFGTHVDIFD